MASRGAGRGNRGAARGNNRWNSRPGGAYGRFNASTPSAAPSRPFRPGGNLMQGATARERREEDHAFDAVMGFSYLEDGSGDSIGYCLNMLPATISSPASSRADEEKGAGASGSRAEDRAVLELFFIRADGSTFKAALVYEPYFYVGLAVGQEERTREVQASLLRKYEGLVASITPVEKEDLEMLNHLAGRRREFLQLKFKTVSDLMAVRSDLKPIIDKNIARVQRNGGGVDHDALDVSNKCGCLMLCGPPCCILT
jgi:DNA polymerase epsilon subunit 1